MVIVKLATFVCAVGVNESVNVNVSAALFTPTVGVPLIVPADEFNAKPARSIPDVIVHVYGVVSPLAVNV
jgi:hypothetical protein